MKTVFLLYTSQVFYFVILQRLLMVYICFLLCITWKIFDIFVLQMELQMRVVAFRSHFTDPISAVDFLLIRFAASDVCIKMPLSGQWMLFEKTILYIMIYLQDDYSSLYSKFITFKDIIWKNRHNKEHTQKRKNEWK